MSARRRALASVAAWTAETERRRERVVRLGNSAAAGAVAPEAKLERRIFELRSAEKRLAAAYEALDETKPAAALR